MRERRRRAFPETFKREAVERVRTSGLPIVRVAEELGLRETVLRRWIARYGTMASPRRIATPVATPSPADLASENARLKRELQRAEMERDILKKAALAIVSRTMCGWLPRGKGFVGSMGLVGRGHVYGV